LYSIRGIKASVSCGPLGKFVSRMAVGTRGNSGTYSFAEVIEGMGTFEKAKKKAGHGGGALCLLSMTIVRLNLLTD
jgi:hypothetical protein